MRISGSREGTHTWNEISSQGEVWKRVLEEQSRSAVVKEILDGSARRRRWVFIGCGTSYYLAEAAAVSWSTLTGQPAIALPSSEVLLFPELIRSEGEDVQTVAISRSGRTSETVRAAAALKSELRLPVIGISCEAGSKLEATCDKTIVLTACDEQSTVMTRSFTSMLLSLQLLGAQRGGKVGFVEELQAMAGKFAASFGEWAEAMERLVAAHTFADFVFLGQGGFHGIAREAALR